MIIPLCINAKFKPTKTSKLKIIKNIISNDYLLLIIPKKSPILSNLNEILYGNQKNINKYVSI